MTDRAKIANVRSITDQKDDKTARRRRKATGQADAARAMVPVDRVNATGRSLEAANESVSLQERERAALARMEDRKLFSDRQLELLGIVHPRSRQRELVDSMRQLRTKLFTLQPERNFSVLVASVVPSGGGSFVATNLAATIAFDQARTSLLVDANVRNPMAHRLLKLIGQDHAHGLTEYLEHPEIGVESIVSPSGIPRMRIIPTGQHTELGAEHFTSARYRQLMQAIQNRYSNRYVVVDGPAMANSSEGRILSDICDYTVLVVPYGGVSAGVIDAVVDELDQRKLAGVVINDQPA